jgi:hypothetical protein
MCLIVSVILIFGDPFDDMGAGVLSIVDFGNWPLELVIQICI